MNRKGSSCGLTENSIQTFAWEVLTEWTDNFINRLNTELNPMCYLLALFGAHHILHISRIKVKTASCLYRVELRTVRMPVGSTATITTIRSRDFLCVGQNVPKGQYGIRSHAYVLWCFIFHSENSSRFKGAWVTYSMCQISSPVLPTLSPQLC